MNSNNENNTRNCNTCDNCIADNAVTCAQCGGLCNIENAYYDEKEEDYICNYCKEDGEWQ